MAYEDLLKDTSESFEDGNYFVVTIEELDPGTVYPLQFRWKYKDGTYGKDWSATYNLTLSSEQVPGAPGVTADGNTPGMITITWDGKNVQNTDIQDRIKQVDIYISGSPFDGTKPAISFDKAGTKTVSAPAGVYNIVAYGLTARGTVSTQTTISNITVNDIAASVEAPTLPSGLSVAAAPFAVSVNWSGTYSSSDFDGFKSIDIHVRGSDVGSTATSGFSTTTQVATLTVTGTTNRQNIGLDNLRQALSLANNQAAYTSPMFFYYIARNVNDALYSVGGTPTYTRINSTSVNPTQANFVDLVNGIISIENLVAGNGKFTSWLRTGGTYVNGVFQGGTRIELSSVNDFPDPTNASYNILKGLTAYNSGNTKIFDLDLDAGTLTIEGSGKFTGDLEAGSGSSIFKSDSDGIYLGATTFAGAASKFRVSRSGVMNAASGTIGGLTLASDAISNSASTFKIGSTGQLLLGSESAGQNNLLLTPTQIVHRTGSTATGIFTLDIATGTLSLSGYANTAALANKSKTYYQNNEPTSGMIQGDIWIDANDNYKVYTYTGTAWQLSQDSAAAQTTANTAANRAQKFDIVGNVNLGIALNNSGSIYSNKTTYGSGTTGWFLGYRDLGGGTYTPAIDIGGTTSYVRWTGSVLEIKGNITADSGSFTGNIYASGGTIGGWTVDSNGYLTNNSDTWLHPSTGYTTGGYSSTNFSIISSRGISGSTIQATSSSATSIQTSGGITLSGDISSTGDITTSGDISVTGTGVITSNGLVTALNGINVSAGGINVLSGNVFVKNTASTQYLESNRLRVVGDEATSGTGTIYANFLGTGTGASIIQTTGGFLRVSSSSQRYKENIQAINKNGYLNIIAQLRPVTFNYKEEFAPDDYMVVSSGLIAEEVDQIEELKTIVNYNKDNQPESISYDRLSALLVLAIQEIKDKLESIEQRLDALEG